MIGTFRFVFELKTFTNFEKDLLHGAEEGLELGAALGTLGLVLGIALGTLVLGELLGSAQQYFS